MRQIGSVRGSTPSHCIALHLASPHPIQSITLHCISSQPVPQPVVSRFFARRAQPLSFLPLPFSPLTSSLHCTPPFSGVCRPTFSQAPSQSRLSLRSPTHLSWT
ncbi:unnamed protein product [Closterium sp. NIES-65]|nr:unnamed protein product [Closterium sp. NIES-65]